MTHTANNLIPAPGKFRSALAVAGAFLESLDYVSDYPLNRIERLERVVAQLKEELRQRT
ncbi:hypothetical protein [Novosphingobium sp.]|uniref:hypothetical protein n=1 Tax=Novosphingobium sp. TaxID=1874826 RepID=UPI003B5223F3